MPWKPNEVPRLEAQESIKASKDWFMACAPHAAGLAAQMAEYCGQGALPYDKLLHVIYLANDVLLKGYGGFRPPACDMQDVVRE